MNSLSNINRDAVTARVADYFEYPEMRPIVLEFFLQSLDGIIDEEIAHQKLILLPHERYAEASWAVLEAIGSWDHNLNSTFEQNFLYEFRKALRQLKPRKDHVCIEGLAIEDPSANPESLYIIKEQMELIKEFLSKRYSPIAVDQFMRRYADGQTFAEIAQEYSVTTASLIPKMSNMLDRVSKYMKRINNE